MEPETRRLGLEHQSCSTSLQAPPSDEDPSDRQMNPCYLSSYTQHPSATVRKPLSVIGSTDPAEDRTRWFHTGWSSFGSTTTMYCNFQALESSRRTRISTNGKKDASRSMEYYAPPGYSTFPLRHIPCPFDPGSSTDPQITGLVSNLIDEAEKQLATVFGMVCSMQELVDPRTCSGYGDRG